MSAAADRLRTIGSTVSPQVSGSAWQGPDQAQFLSTWNGTSYPLLLSTAEALSVQADALMRNADDQEGTSDAAGGGIGGGSGGPGGSGGSGGTGPGGGGGGGAGSEDDSGWLFGLPDWVGTASTLAGTVVGAADTAVGLLDEFGYIAQGSRFLTGAAGVLSLVTMADGIAEMYSGITEGNGWATADGVISTAIGGAGATVAVLALASNPVGWAVAAGIGVAGVVWGGLNLLTPEGMETTEWIGGMASDAWNATTGFVGDVGGNVVSGLSSAADATASFVDDVTAPLRRLNPFG
ncbi:hypothetical protein [Oerskovia flava]|uniref:hypothetical protein n=1 Tax=Oerskovia flava TaxID=2986422 RepID=UPI00223FE522|nr:hypothetical protein [Oerskovia sp. JB1-3-2]